MFEHAGFKDSTVCNIHVASYVLVLYTQRIVKHPMLWTDYNHELSLCCIHSSLKPGLAYSCKDAATTVTTEYIVTTGKTTFRCGTDG